MLWMGRCKTNQLFGLVLVFTFLLASVDGQGKAKKPLLITKRRHDSSFLQLLRLYQQPLAHEELALERGFKINQTNEAGETKEVNITYYVNDQLEADEITHDHLTVGSLHHAYTTRMFNAYMYYYDSRLKRDKSSDKRLLSKRRCERDLRYLLDNLPGKKRSVKPELAALYDSYGEAEFGLLQGNFRWLGLPNECQRRLIIEPDLKNQTNSIVFRGRPCRASIESPSWKKLIRYQRDKLLEANNFFTDERQAHEYERYFHIQIGVCLPDSCSSESFDWARDQIKELAMHKLDDSYGSFELTNLFCPPDETSEFRKIEPMGRLFIWLYGLWLGAMCLATLFDHQDTKETQEVKKPKGTLDKLISSMSFKTNWRRLMSLRETPEPVPGQPAASDMAFMNFFRASFTPLVIWCHSALLIYEYRKFTNMYQFPDLGPAYNTIMAGLYCVDAFFFFSGFASAYIMFQQKLAEHFKLSQWLYLIFHRYWRLVGVYAIVVWYAKHVQIYTNYGPNWDYATGNTTHRAICQTQSWWPVLTLTSNFVQMSDNCVVTGWYQSNDMQFFLLTPFIIVALHKWPRATWLGSIVAIWLGALLYFQTFYHSRRIFHLHSMRLTDDTCSMMHRDMGTLYHHPWYRFSPYLIGLLAGHYTYMVLSHQWKSIFYKRPSTSSKEQQPTTWPLRLLFIFNILPLCGMNFSKSIIDGIDLSKSGEQVRLLASFAYSIRHINAGIAMAMLSISIMFGAAPGLRRFMSKPIWGLASKFNYGILLIQVEVLWFLILGRDFTLTVTIVEYIMYALFACFVSYAVSFVLTLTLYQPLAKLEQEFVFHVLNGHQNSPAKREQQQLVQSKKSN